MRKNISGNPGYDSAKKEILKPFIIQDGFV